MRLLGRAGFSLVELLVVIAIMAMLLGASLSFFGRDDGRKLKTSGDQLTAMIEQGRTSAITRRRSVVLALLEPGQGGFGDEHCRLGLLELEGGAGKGVFVGRLLQRWQVLPVGVVFFGGTVDSLSNFRDEERIKLEWKNGEKSAEVYALVFSVRGGLRFPEGSESVVLKIGNGTYREGSPLRTSHSGSRTIRVGRVVARPWNLDA